MHIAIIMDGNGRWATARGWPRLTGHRQGAAAVERTVETAARIGIGTLTLYAFSADNWRRSSAEVAGLFTLFRLTLRRHAPRCVAQGIRLSVIGRRDRLPAPLLQSIEDAEAVTALGTRLHVRLAIDYSGRECIAAAAREEATLAGISSRLGPPVDLLIRTSGERRLSDFLLWEAAYAELFFTDRLWPDFRAADLEDALREYTGRDRRFGGLTPIQQKGASRSSPLVTPVEQAS